MVTLLHPVVVDLFNDLSNDIQDVVILVTQEIRSGLLSVVVAQANELKIVAAVGLLTREIIEIDGVEPWVEPLGELMNWASS